MRVTESIRAHILIKGVVQGVFFRSSMKDVADNLGVKGWVRNLPDGETVEAVVEGERSAVEKLISWCLHGPPLAKVVEVHVRFSEAKGEFREFRIIR